MKRHGIWLSILLMELWALPVLAQSGNFDTSLHKMRAGKDYWYGTANGGFENWTQVPIADLKCTECHGPTDANGNPYPEPYPGANCSDCHPSGFFPVVESQCLGCHSRQNAEINLGYSDVHRDASTPLECWDCHGTQDLHGDGTEYNSMLEAGAIDADCTDCHDPLPAGHETNDPHGGALHCAACHVQSVISCYNCHFESQVQHHVKRAKQQLHDYVILVNREKDGKVYPATFQSLSYQGNAFAAFAPYSAHTITSTGARTCTDCHQNMGGSVEAIEQYNQTGEIKFATWNDVDSTLSWIHGVIPFPADYQQSFKMDFITYNGDPSSPPGTDNKNWSFIGKDTWDGHQLFFATPLTLNQMASLGFEVTPVTLAFFTAERRETGAVLTWKVGYASDHAGFHVHREEATRERVRLTDVMLHGQTTYEFVDETAPPGETTYWLEEIATNGDPSWHGPVQLAPANAATAPPSITLAPAEPSPFAESTRIAYALPASRAVRLAVYDVSGRVVRVLVDEVQAPGSHVARWDGRSDSGQAANGLYMLRLDAGEETRVEKVLLIH